MSEPDQDQLLDEAKKLSFQVQAILRGRHHDAVSAALVDVVSVWIAGHLVMDPGDDPRKGPWSQRTLDQTRKHRLEVLSHLMKAIEALVQISAAERGLPHDPIDKDPERWANAHFRRQ